MAVHKFIDRNICVAPIPGTKSTYGYTPSLGAGIAFCVLFGLSMVLHTFTSIRYRTWWQLVFTVGALCEVLGWAGRTWSHYCLYMTTPYLLQICTLIIAPTFFTAGIYVILGRLIRSFGRGVSPISAAAYLYIFCTADVVSLVIQAAGGGMAAVAYEQNPPKNTDNGTHIMVAGILFQLASILVFVSLFVVVIFRSLKSKGELLTQRRIQWIIAAMVLSVVLIVARSIYRTIELLQGWSGYLITTERYFIALDGAMMVGAVGVFNIARPGWSNITDKSTDVGGESEVEMTDRSDKNN
ncbi:RTA1-domain-containing protein [Hyaloscypha hepaticicola]|uniref:RTA1-domain-containing protein n=1 Tax=Hyaloscypha hepaticicola TaxID=2082293 RepID=A0A2J6QKI2_9HELO|nr:RTA1-domain-containing protein [Hyaloscypha hepaticicola]